MTQETETRKTETREAVRTQKRSVWYPVYLLYARVAEGEMSMHQAQEEIQKWYNDLPEEAKQQVKQAQELQRFVLVGEGLMQGIQVARQG